MIDLEIINKNGQVVTTSRMVAHNFAKRHDNVIADIRGILETQETQNMFYETTYINEQNKQEYPQFLMNRDGFTLLAMGFTGSSAMQWKIKYIQAFNEMEKQLQPKPMTQLEILAQSAQILLEQEKAIKELTANQTKQAEDLQSIRDVITLSTVSWREDTKNLLVKIARKTGDVQIVSDLWSDAYKLLDSRMGVNVKQRLVNLRKNMAIEGASKSKQSNTNTLDVIGLDKKLVEGFVAIVKEMAIKADVA